jgi:hypothetical protein
VHQTRQSPRRAHLEASDTSASSRAPTSGDGGGGGESGGEEGVRRKVILFDPKVLAAYLLSTYQMRHPVSRRKLARSDCQVTYPPRLCGWRSVSNERASCLAHLSAGAESQGA